MLEVEPDLEFLMMEAAEVAVCLTLAVTHSVVLVCVMAEAAKPAAVSHDAVADLTKNCFLCPHSSQS
eukprot:COSAG05_NODE_694_length_7891_cov_5.305570_6_plen_67_part_00